MFFDVMPSALFDMSVILHLPYYRPLAALALFTVVNASFASNMRIVSLG